MDRSGDDPDDDDDDDDDDIIQEDSRTPDDGDVCFVCVLNIKILQA